MLSDSSVFSTIPVNDLMKAKGFYENVLGLKFFEQTPEGIVYQAGSGTRLYIYQRPMTASDHTEASFDVSNIEEAVADLSQKGVVFEHYNMGNIKTDEKGIATIGALKAAWFKDPDGNILAINQRK